MCVSASEWRGAAAAQGRPKAHLRDVRPCRRCRLVTSRRFDGYTTCHQRAWVGLNLSSRGHKKFVREKLAFREFHPVRKKFNRVAIEKTRGHIKFLPGTS